MRVETASGPVIGRSVGHGVRRFLGIPYAQPPVGPHRFEPPQPRPAWTEPFDAGSYGPTAPQAEPTGPIAPLLPHVSVPGDDYLNLNVWAPDHEVDGGHPVLVFLHGGSFTSGSGAIGGYDGTRFAERDVVLVTLNYRLGADGFAWFGEGTPNLGLLDQVMALRWVRDHIAAFGGDPARVTVFGESAGGMSIGALLAMPAARGLFRRAIMQSGCTFHTISPRSARRIGRRLARLLRVEPTRAGLAGVGVADLIAAQSRVARELGRLPLRSLWGEAAETAMPFDPVVDGEILPTRPIEALRAGGSGEVELMVGWNADEANFVLAPYGLSKIKSWLVPLAALRTELPRHRVLRAARTYRRLCADAGPAGALGAMATDWIYRIPAIRTAEAEPRTHVYEFGWRSPGYDGDLGACHGIELPFVFDNLDHPDWRPMVGDAPPHALAEEVQRAWIAFARDGDPGWPRYGPDRIVRRFDTPTVTRTDPDREARLLWTGLR